MLRTDITQNMDQELRAPFGNNVGPKDLDHIEALATAATKGPWETTDDKCWTDHYTGLSIQPVTESWDSDCAHPCCSPLEPEDVEFIAAARAFVPASVTEIRCLRLQLDTARETIHRMDALHRDHERAGLFDADAKERAAPVLENQILQPQVARDHFDAPVAKDVEGK